MAVTNTYLTADQVYNTFKTIKTSWTKHVQQELFKVAISNTLPVQLFSIWQLSKRVKVEICFCAIDNCCKDIKVPIPQMLLLVVKVFC